MNLELEAKRLEEWDNSPDILELLTVLTDEDILEIGCGTGRIIEDLAKTLKNSNFTGIDLQEYFIKIAQNKRIINATFIQADALDVVFPAERFDYIIFRDSLHQIKENTGVNGIRQSLKNAYFYLKDKGKLVIRDAIKPNPKKVDMRLNSDIQELFSLFLRNSMESINWHQNDDVFTLDITDLVSFLGNMKKLQMNQNIQFRKSTQLTIHEYNEILNEAGFTQEEVRLYKFSPHIIPEGMCINRNELPETYCMLLYQKK